MVVRETRVSDGYGTPIRAVCHDNMKGLTGPPRGWSKRFFHEHQQVDKDNVLYFDITQLTRAVMEPRLARKP